MKRLTEKLVSVSHYGISRCYLRYYKTIIHTPSGSIFFNT
nr:MAG TPA: hypothetical protein [Caudoviricetes sp.]DAZ29529.1 MAG TPA: hypothetical protein [Caudoviricetes sp.]